MTTQDEILEKEVSVDMRIMDMMVITGELILALKLPENNGPSADMARGIARTFMDTLVIEGIELPQDVLEEWKHALGYVPPEMAVQITVCRGDGEA